MRRREKEGGGREPGRQHINRPFNWHKYSEVRCFFKEKKSFFKHARKMRTWCRERDKTSLGIHERGSEFLVTIGSFCQIWWGLHTAAGWNDLLEEKEASLFFCPSDDMCILGRACVCVFVLHVYKRVFEHECAGSASCRNACQLSAPGSCLR